MVEHWNHNPSVKGSIPFSAKLLPHFLLLKVIAIRCFCGGYSSIGRTAACGAEGYGFKSH